MGKVKVYYKCDYKDKLPKETVTLMKKVIISTVSEHYPEHNFEVSLTVCDDGYIRELNREYREKDSSTDVLSFPMFDFDTPEVMTLLGDIVVSADTALRQADLYGHSPEREFCFLCVHSALHLLGYDHEDDEESRAVMEKKQEEILKGFGLGKPEEKS